MRRYTNFILTAVMIILAAVAGRAVPVDADKKTYAKPTAQLTAYTTLPAETAAVLSEVYERENKVRVNFVPMSSGEILQKIKDDAVSDPTVVRTVDIVIADSKILREAADLNLFTPHTSEANDAVREIFKDEQDRWTGIWYDPIIFCANKDFLKRTVDLPDTWEKSDVPNDHQLRRTKNLRNFERPSSQSRPVYKIFVEPRAPGRHGRS